MILNRLLLNLSFIETIDMTKKEKIDRFISAKELILAGVSRDEKKFGFKLFDELIKKGYVVYPTNPNIDRVNGTQCYKSIKDTPTESKHLLVLTPKKVAKDIVAEAIDKKIQMIWFQKGSTTKEAVELAKKNNIETITGECLFMYLTPVKGPHRFHRFLRKLFGTMPK